MENIDFSNMNDDEKVKILHDLTERSKNGYVELVSTSTDLRYFDGGVDGERIILDDWKGTVHDKLFVVAGDQNGEEYDEEITIKELDYDWEVEGEFIGESASIVKDKMNLTEIYKRLFNEKLN